MKKEDIKAKLLEPIAVKLKDEWHSQATHKMAVGVFWLDAAGIKDATKREELLKAWHETPGAFGTNSSALGQSLGRPKAVNKIEETFKGF